MSWLEAAQNKFFRLSWVTGSWFLEEDVLAESIKCHFWRSEHHKPSAIERMKTSLWPILSKLRDWVDIMACKTDFWPGWHSLWSGPGPKDVLIILNLPTQHQSKMLYLGLVCNHFKTLAKKNMHEESQRSCCLSSTLTAERKTTLNYKSEPCGGLEQLPERREGAGSLPFPVRMGWCVQQNNGRNHILPSCPGSQGFSDKHEKQRYQRPGLLPGARGGHSAGPAAGDPSLPPSSYWTFGRCRSCDTQASQLCLLCQTMINTSVSRYLW